MPTLVTICRTHAKDFGQRELFATLDDGTAISLPYPTSVTVDVTPGQHRLRVTNGLMRKTFEFAVAAGEHVEFQCMNKGSWYTLGMLTILGSAPLYLRVTQRTYPA